MTITLNGTTGITTPDVTSSGSLNIDASAPDDSLVVDASGNVGVGISAPTSVGGGADLGIYRSGGSRIVLNNNSRYLAIRGDSGSDDLRIAARGSSDTVDVDIATFTTSGNLLVGKTASSNAVVGVDIDPVDGLTVVTDVAPYPVFINRQTSDGTLILFRQANTTEGSISVSGTTVSYNGGHLARFAQTATAKDESLVKGTVLSNLDEMNVYVDADGNAVENEQLNKVKVSDVEGDVNVAGVFVNWAYDDQHSVDEINMAMTGDMIIRIAQGTTVQRGDLLMSAGDGTAKPQGDDIVRSKTIAKVTSTNVTCTYTDGSYCVPCVLMAC